MSDSQERTNLSPRRRPGSILRAQLDSGLHRNDGKESLAVYVHWPFCLSKCPYCDFNSHVQDGVDQSEWADAYAQDLSYYRTLTGPRRVTSIFFGGGTPSLMAPGTTEKIIQKIGDLWEISPEAEITLEANPTSAEVKKFNAFKNSGINRISIGIQSLIPEDLKFLGRQHDVQQGIQTIEFAQKIFDRVSFDLIYARPGQTQAAWEEELQQALALGTPHLSLYQLTIEEQTPFFTQHNRGDFSIPDEELASDFYKITESIMTAAGRPPYEISNYARPGQESVHNLAYWRYQDYVGVGPGAHGRIGFQNLKLATRGHRAPSAWLKRVQENGNGGHSPEIVTREEQRAERLLMGLRLTEGMDLENTGIDPLRIETLIGTGDLHLVSKRNDQVLKQNDRIAPTLPGRLRLNQVIAYLLGA